MIEHCRVTGKVRIKSKKIAQRVAKRMRDDGRPNASSYECEHCGGWHTTSMSQTEFRRRKREAA